MNSPAYLLVAGLSLSENVDRNEGEGPDRQPV